MLITQFEQTNYRCTLFVTNFCLAHLVEEVTGDLVLDRLKQYQVLNCVLKMDSLEKFEKRKREINTPKALFFKEMVRQKFYDQPLLYQSFLRILTEYTHGRIDPEVMYLQVSDLFWPCVVMTRGFCNSFLKRVCPMDDDIETPRAVKKAKIEDGSSKATTVFDPTSHASTSYASDYSQSPCSSSSYLLEMEAVASCSSSSSSRPGSAAEAYEAQKKKAALRRKILYGEGRILYVTARKTKRMKGLQVYHLIELVNVLEKIGVDTYDIMKRVSNFLEGYPELIELFNIFLPDGFRIVIRSDDHEMSTD